MSDITAANVTITQGFKDESPGLCQNGDSLNTPTLTVGNGSLTYPTYGIPLPDLGQFRLKFGITRMLVLPQVPAGYIWLWDKTVRTGAPNGTIRAFALNGGTEMSGAVTAVTLDLIVLGA